MSSNLIEVQPISRPFGWTKRVTTRINSLLLLFWEILFLKSFLLSGVPFDLVPKVSVLAQDEKYVFGLKPFWLWFCRNNNLWVIPPDLKGFALHHIAQISLKKKIPTRQLICNQVLSLYKCSEPISCMFQNQLCFWP